MCEEPIWPATRGCYARGSCDVDVRQCKCEPGFVGIGDLPFRPEASCLVYAPLVRLFYVAISLVELLTIVVCIQELRDTARRRTRKKADGWSFMIIGAGACIGGIMAMLRIVFAETMVIGGNVPITTLYAVCLITKHLGLFGLTHNMLEEALTHSVFARMREAVKPDLQKVQWCNGVLAVVPPVMATVLLVQAAWGPDLATTALNPFTTVYFLLMLSMIGSHLPKQHLEFLRLKQVIVSTDIHDVASRNDILQQKSPMWQVLFQQKGAAVGPRPSQITTSDEFESHTNVLTARLDMYLVELRKQAASAFVVLGTSACWPFMHTLTAYTFPFNHLQMTSVMLFGLYIKSPGFRRGVSSAKGWRDAVVAWCSAMMHRGRLRSAPVGATGSMQVQGGDTQPPRASASPMPLRNIGGGARQPTQMLLDESVLDSDPRSVSVSVQAGAGSSYMGAFPPSDCESVEEKEKRG